jgi:hypothetical protein
MPDHRDQVFQNVNGQWRCCRAVPIHPDSCSTGSAVMSSITWV